MCGIAGFRTRSAAVGDNADLLSQMLDRLRHRGPDHKGVYCDKAVGLGNQRLKVIDIEGGDQPIANEDGSVSVVYNGEIYNFRELRKDLVARGHFFKTRCDTEVLVHLYEEYGRDMLPLLNGMFAFALYDRNLDALLVARDRFGVKPLFYTQTNAGFFFASEIGALRLVPGFDCALDYQAVSIFLAQMYIPQPWSVFANTKRLRAGHYLWVTADRAEEHCYSDFDLASKEKMSAGEAREEVIRLLSASVERQLVADVPVGIFLSGGLDSTSLLVMANKLGSRLSSFTLSYEEQAYDENERASRWASRFADKHHRVVMSERDFLDRLQSRMAHNGEPLGPWITVGSQMLAEQAAANGFKVALNGAGGDEFFCGYPTLNAAVAAKAYGLVPRALREGVIVPLVNRLPAGEGALPLAHKLKLFAGALDKDPYRTFFNFKMVTGPRQYGHLLSGDARAQLEPHSPYAAFEQYRDRIAGWSLIDALSYLDIKTFMEGSVLHLSDNASMSASLEERVPFLDNELVDFACKIPNHINFKISQVKPVLKKGVRDYLEKNSAPDLIKGYRKLGFELPGNAWIRSGELQHFLSDNLLSGDQSFFNPHAVREVLDDHIQGRRNNERVLQTMLGMVYFLRQVA
jgi:asparagine synthase (glutamine-hydrolysing)